MLATNARVIKALVLTAVLMQLSLPLPQSSAQPHVTITGRVVDDSWSEVEGVWVRAQSFSGFEFVAETFTDEDGVFKLTVQGGGEVIKRSYTIFYSKKGFRDYIEVVNIGAENVNLSPRVLQPVPANLELSSLLTESTVRAGEEAKIPFTVKNLENSSVIVTFKLKTPLGWDASVMDASGRVAALSLSGAGNTSSSAHFDVSYEVPLDAKGYYPLSLQTHQNSSAILNYIVYVEPLKDEDLVYASLKHVMAMEDSTVGFDITLSNPSLRRLDVALSMKAPEGWNTTTNVGTSSVSVVSLKAKESLGLRAMVSIPEGAAQGTYDVAFMADFGFFTFMVPLKVTVNVREAEVFSASDFIFVSYPHLVSAPEESVKFSLKITNPYSTIQYTDIEVRVPQGWTYVVMGETSRILGLSLLAKQSVSVELHVDAPSEVADGTYVIPFTMRSEKIDVTIPLKVTVSRTITYPGAQIELTTTNPYQEAYGGRSIRYDLFVENNADEPDLVDLAVTGLHGDFTSTFQDTKGQDIRRIYVVNGSRASFSLTVTVPEAASMGAVPINVTATARWGSDVLPLTLEVAGKYSLSIQTQNLFTSLTIGSKGTFSVTTVNDGTQDLTNVRVEIPSAALPDGLNMTSTPASMAVLRRGDQATFTLNIESTTDLTVGTYPILFTIVSDKASSSQYFLTIQAAQSSNIFLFGIGIVVAGIAAVALVFRRMGRR